jgi:hypothetical protein
MGGFVGAGSVFAYFQGLGMTLGATIPILPAALALPAAAAPALPAVGAGGAVVAGLAALLF